MRIPSTWLAGLSILALASPALADWPAGGKPALYVLQSQNGVLSAGIAETPSGDLMVIGQGRGGAGTGLNVTRIGRDGNFAAGWDAFGACLGATGFGTRLFGWAADDSNGFWTGRAGGGGTSVIHASPFGLAEPNCTGWYLGGGSFAYAAAMALGSSDVYLAMSPGTIRRLTRAGTVAPGWPAGGRAAFGPVSSLAPAPTMLPDGAGGVVLYNMTDNGPRASRVDANSSLHAGWPAGGLALGTVLYPYQPFNWPARTLVPSGPDHFLALWTDFPNTTASPALVRLQRFALDGTLDPAWPATGLVVVPADTIANVTLVADGLAGAYVLWERSGLPYGKHVLADGSYAAGSASAGVSLLPAGANYLPIVSANLAASTNLPWLVADRGLDGGLVFVWCEPSSRPTRVMRVRWLLADLTPDPVEPEDGLRIEDGSDNAFAGIQRAALADGEGGIFLAWESFLGDGGTGHEWTLAMTRVGRPSVTGVPAALPAASFALGGAMPNPVRGSVTLRCTLPGERAARLELFDVGGRRWRSAEVSGAGGHVVRFDDLGGLPAGLYLARLTLGADSRTSRFVRLP